MLQTDGSGFHFISTDCLRWRYPMSSYIDIPDMLFFKDLKYFDPSAIYSRHKAHFLTNQFRKPMFGYFFEYT
jgi:hypothetical protein